MTTAAIEPALAEPEISTGELSSRIGEPGLCVVDVRPLFLYNGWSEPGAARGGHIPGAVALPSAWLSRLDESELQELLVDKGISEGAEVVIYGSAEGTSLLRERVAASIDAPLRTYAGWRRVDRRREPPPRAAGATTRSSSITSGSGSCSVAASRKRHRQAGTSSSTSTSASPRSTSTAICPVRSTSTRISSRARATGIDALPKISKRPCERSGSQATRR